MKYTITFYTDWHCGSGLSSGADVDATVIRDANGLPYLPGKSLKGVLREMAQLLVDAGHYEQSLVDSCFGKSDADSQQIGELFFGNSVMDVEGSIPDHLKPFLFRKLAATAIDDLSGTTTKGSLRKQEVAVPLTLVGELGGDSEPYQMLLTQAMGLVKGVGVNRNRGLGRCRIYPTEGGAVR